MGFKIKLPDAITDLTLPILYPDEIMSNGSLFLMDLSHSQGDSGTSLDDGGKINNIAHEVAAGVIGSGDEETLKGNVDIVNISPSDAILEITTKKGIHGIISKANSINDLGWDMALPALIRQYIFDNYTTKKLYVSIWGRVTRISDTDTSAFSGLGSNVSFTGNYLNYMGAANTFPGSGGSFLGRRQEPDPTNVLGNFIRTIGSFGNIGTPPPLLANLVSFIKIGPGSAFGGFEAGKSHSLILYRYYVEDLDVSGRSYAEVDALDKAMYDTAFALGGKFYDDSFTDPSVLP